MRQRKGRSAIKQAVQCEARAAVVVGEAASKNMEMPIKIISSRNDHSTNQISNFQILTQDYSPTYAIPL
jgi:hypothetical protein